CLSLPPPTRSDLYTLSLHDALPISLKMPFFSTLPVHGKIDIEPSLSALVNGARFTATGQALPFAEDRSSTLTLDIGTSDLLRYRSEEHTSELQSRENLVCRLLLEKK